MPPDKPKIAVIILAAGDSGRMNGEPKQLLVFRGETLLRRAVETAIRAKFYATIVVLGANYEKFRKEIENLPVEIAINKNWKTGMSSSIKTGLSILAGKKPDAVVIMLCDQPLITTKNLLELSEIFIRTGSPVVASKYENTIGVPALFAKKVFAELMDLTEDQGAKSIIKKYVDHSSVVLSDEAGFDVDVFEDYERLKLLEKQKNADN